MSTRQRSCLVCNKRFFWDSPSQRMCSKRCRTERQRIAKQDSRKRGKTPTKQELIHDTSELLLMRKTLIECDQKFKRAIKEGRYEDAIYPQTAIPIGRTRQKTLYELRQEVQGSKIH